MAATSSGWVTSHLTHAQMPPPARISAVTSASLAGSDEAIITRAPRLAASRAVAAPMPWLPPVISSERPLNVSRSVPDIALSPSLKIPVELRLQRRPRPGSSARRLADGFSRQGNRCDAHEVQPARQRRPQYELPFLAQVMRA